MRTQTIGTADLQDVANVMVQLHKEQFGRGPVTARADFAGPNALLCVLEGVLLPAEHAMVAMGEQQRVRESRLHFQAATRDKFVTAVEEIVYRKVRAFGSAIDADNDVVFENFYFESRAPNGDGNAS